ncbi:hypothetical protein AAK913_12205 [Enterococcus faecium]|uniref:hypothetical protein n=1 Tax=Enterococcus faecium TaxID=1352 RepID=UPI0035121DA6
MKENIVQKLFNVLTVEQSSPDNLWVNSYMNLTESEVVEEFRNKYGIVSEDDDIDVSEYINAHEDELNEFVEEFYSCTLLGRANGEYHVLQ